MVVEGSLAWYNNQAKKLICRYGKPEMLKDPDNIGMVIHYMVVADETYDPTRGAKKSSWRLTRAIYAIKNIARKMRSNNIKKRTMSINFDMGDGTELWEIIETQRSVEKEEVDLKTVVEKSMLNEQQRECITMYIDGDTMLQIGKKLGLSKQRISQVINKGVDIMKETFNEQA